MNFVLTADQEAIRKTVQEFTAKRIAPGAAERDDGPGCRLLGQPGSRELVLIWQIREGKPEPSGRRGTQICTVGRGAPGRRAIRRRKSVSLS